MMMIVGGIAGLGGLFGVWPEALGIGVQEHLLAGMAVNMAVIIIGLIVFCYGVRIGDFR